MAVSRKISDRHLATPQLGQLVRGYLRYFKVECPAALIE